MSDYFPPEILLQILHKLSIKSLVHCTCVCKTWESIIKNPSFISKHLTLTISSNTTTNTHLLLFRFFSEESEHYTLHFDDQQLSPYMQLDFPYKSYKPYFRVTGTINGIICIIDDSVNFSDTFILWNPLIKRSITLPKPNVTVFKYGCYNQFIGFGFDSKTNDYKVLRIVHNVFSPKEAAAKQKPFMEVQLYSLNTNSWKSMTCVAPKYQLNDQVHAFVNGVVHWIAFQYEGVLGCRNVVSGFDMGDEVFCEIKLPESLANVIPIDMFVRKYGDSSIMVIKNDLRDPLLFHIWVMKEYGVVESWTKLLSISTPGELMRTVLGFRRSGEVLVQTFGGKIVSYDPQNKGGRNLGLRKQMRLAFADSYVESLVLIDNANAVSDVNVANDVIEDESDDSSDDGNDAANDDSSDDGSNAASDTSDDGSHEASDAAITLMQMGSSK